MYIQHVCLKLVKVPQNFMYTKLLSLRLAPLNFGTHAQPSKLHCSEQHLIFEN